MVFELPELEYGYNALEPFIDSGTMEIHYTKHHQGYVDKLNMVLKDHEEIQDKPIEELIREVNSISEAIREAVRNNGGGHLNHSFFWKILQKNVKIKGEILNAINKNFDSFENFKEQFKSTGLALFGSGWVWLVFNPTNKKLEIMQTKNQENPITFGKIPLLGLDVWEHAYYLKYQNKRGDYIDAFFNVINWDKVNENYLKAAA